MYDQYEYINTIYTAAGIGKIFKASNISIVEDLLKDFKATFPNCVIVRDAGDGNLNLKDRRLDTAYHTLYVFAKGKFNSPDDNMIAKRTAMQKAIALFDRMKLDAVDFGDPAYGFDASRVEYSEIGPIGQQYFGYSFSYTMEHDF